MEELRSSETSVTSNPSTPCNTPEDKDLHQHCCDNVKWSSSHPLSCPISSHTLWTMSLFYPCHLFQHTTMTDSLPVSVHTGQFPRSAVLLTDTHTRHTAKHGRCFCARQWLIQMDRGYLNLIKYVPIKGKFGKRHRNRSPVLYLRTVCKYATRRMNCSRALSLRSHNSFILDKQTMTCVCGQSVSFSVFGGNVITSDGQLFGKQSSANVGQGSRSANSMASIQLESCKVLHYFSAFVE